jgi:quercetin dioxygenase-like cupin family protein
MRLHARLPKLLALAATFGELCSAVPIEDSPRQRLLMGLDLPEKYRLYKDPLPYTPEHEDKLDNYIDAVGEKLDPLPWRNGEGATVLGPWNKDRARQGPDLIRPPSTDHGSMANMRWSFVDSHIRIEVSFRRAFDPSRRYKKKRIELTIPQEGGWTRETTIRELPTSVELAGVNMRLDEGVIRELHWHKEAEWAYVLEGNVRITGIDYEGGNFVDDLEKGDLWYFPSGVPHSLQGLGPNGTEFLLVFDDGRFSEDSTFILTEWFGKNCRIPKSRRAFN